MISKMKAAVVSASSMVLALPVVVAAQYQVPTNEYGLAEQADAGTLITDIIQFIAGLLGILAILAIVISGIMYITSGGDEGRTDTAKQWLTFAIIGLIVALLAWVIVNVVSGTLVG